MKIFKSCITTGLLVALFLVIGRYFMVSYKAYAVNKQKKAVLIRKVNLLNRIKSERERNIHSILRINNFVNQAKLLGLEQNNWEIYNVDIKETVTFNQMKKILNQCSNANSHYFKPESFHIKSLKATGNDEKSSRMTFENEAGDILMTLKGAFVVKNQKVLNH